MTLSGSLDDLAGTAGSVLLLGLPGTTLDAPTAAALEGLRPAGVTLFGRNLENPDQVRRLVDDLRRRLGPRTLVAIDQEGGQVSRLEPFLGATPTAARLAQGGPAPEGLGRLTAAALVDLGINVDFAPVVDLCPPEATNGIGDRSFGTAPGAVVDAAGRFLNALQDGGVAGCLKHFPGLGDTAVDSHEVMPIVRRARERIEREDLEPFRRLATRAAAVMVGHAAYPTLGDQTALPATASPTLVSGLLRGELQFRGLVVTDDLEMGAVCGRDGAGGMAVDAMRAGCDLLLYCKDLGRARAARDALAATARSSEAFAARLSDASSRVAAFAHRWPARGARSDWSRLRAEAGALLERTPRTV